MAKECNNTSCDKASCEGCSSSKKQQSFQAEMNAQSNVKHVIGVVSGKGGVGKSFVTGSLANMMAAQGYKVGILDADITGPSIPRAFGIHDGVTVTPDGKLLVPAVSSTGVEVISSNMLLENETDPVIWRGPVIAGAVKQFWSETLWQDIDYMFVDMPPGTGDVALTVFQSLPIDGIVIVSTPQDLVKMIVNKAYNMANMMNVPVLGLIENMSYYVCPNCNEKINIFGKSKIDETAAELGVPVLAKLPINPEINLLVDEGRISEIEANELDDFVELLK